MNNVEIRYLDCTAKILPNETVLEALERNGTKVSHSCRSGVCQSCLMRAVSGSPPNKSQQGLKASLRDSGHFLACICHPSESLECEPALSAPYSGTVAVSEIKAIGPDVALVRFTRPIDFNFSGGQFVTFTRPDGVKRSYSIASSQENRECFDIHVRLVADGQFSNWVHNEAKPGDRLFIEGPKGDCMYYPGSPGEHLTMVGVGTGIAPLYAVAIEALKAGHLGPIHFYQGGLSESRLYFTKELSQLAETHRNLTYSPCVLTGPANRHISIGKLDDIVVANLATPRSQRVYLCGDPAIVEGLTRRVFLAGVSLKSIHSDPFVGTGLENTHNVID